MGAQDREKDCGSGSLTSLIDNNPKVRLQSQSLRQLVLRNQVNPAEATLLDYSIGRRRGAFLNTKMPKTRQQKIETVTTLTDKLSRAKSVIFADYKGLTMSTLSEMRKQIREQGAEFGITKNNLLRIALKDSQLPISDELLNGPTATLFSFEDEISPIKVLTKTLKDSQIGKIKGGLFNGELMDEYMINKLAALPSKDELRAKTVGVLVAPLHGIVGVLNANLRNLVYALDQIRISRGGEV